MSSMLNSFQKMLCAIAQDSPSDYRFTSVGPMMPAAVAEVVDVLFEEYPLLSRKGVRAVLMEQLVDVMSGTTVDDCLNCAPGHALRLSNAVRAELLLRSNNEEELLELSSQLRDGESNVGQRDVSGSVDEFADPAQMAWLKLLVGKSGGRTGPSGHCFRQACGAARVLVDLEVRSVQGMTKQQREDMASKSDYKVMAVMYSTDDCRNHLALVPESVPNYAAMIEEFSGPNAMDGGYALLVTSLQHFFRDESWFSEVVFYASQAGDPDKFAGLADDGGVGSPGGAQAPPAGDKDRFVDAQFRSSGSKKPVAGPSDHSKKPSFGRGPGYASQGLPPPESVEAEYVPPGGSNVSAGVVRGTRRKIAPKSKGAMSERVSKGYKASDSVMFNNADEMFQDKISREYAQEIIEELFEKWKVPLDQEDALKFAEDMLYMFLIAVTASNKADYNQSYVIPLEPGTGPDFDGQIEVNMIDLSIILESGHNKTRRQFARALADDMRAFLKQPANTHLLPQLASRVGCETLLAYLAFDGSTHCSAMTTREVAFTRQLETRNLFERPDQDAQGSSDRLMAGFSGGVRSVAPR